MSNDHSINDAERHFKEAIYQILSKRHPDVSFDDETGLITVPFIRPDKSIPKSPGDAPGQVD